MIGAAALISTLLAAVLVPHAQGSTLRRLLPTPVVCSIEHGYDFVGHDVGNAPGHFDSCCTQCSTTASCKAWTWTDFNGGTCWFKSRRGPVVVNKNAKSALRLVQSPALCQVHADLDYVGNDLARVDGAKASDCCDICTKTSGCRAYSWTDFQGGSCWLKSKVTQVAFKAGVYSAEAYPEGYAQCLNVQQGVDFVGNDIGSQRSTMPEGCCDVCKTTTNCRAYTWTDYAGGTCWLKSRFDTFVYTNGTIASATVWPNPEDAFSLSNDTDFEGHDLANVAGKDAIACCDVCEGYDGCKAFTWSDYQGGRCWLKSGQGKAVEKKGVRSGVLRP